MLINQIMEENRLMRDGYRPQHNAFDHILPENTHRCPMCGIELILDEVNCGMFICGQTLYGYVNPHATHEEIRDLQRDGLWIGGCGTALKIENGRLRYI